MSSDTIYAIAHGVYVVEGFKCKCGGTIRIERDPPDRERISGDDFLWESFCTGCLVCDPNGWPTLREALANVREYFGGVA